MRGVQPGDQVALDDHIVVFGPPDDHGRMALVQHDFAVLELQAQAQVRQGAVAHGDGRNHAGHIFGLPEDLIQDDFITLALEGRPHRPGAPLPAIAVRDARPRPPWS